MSRALSIEAGGLDMANLQHVGHLMDGNTVTPASFDASNKGLGVKVRGFDV